ncbi:hypothetical protein RhiirA1_399034 [Rhizophagus irregularis]|uniref:Uncharacterized protein n=1 Tax=Rhizophagus irregularis TaxID=588596 RepID=A0A2I1EX74_9GLOM|nr:hypothetical protein RhiirA1_399034 [Rhizophagus irregularis]PKY26715.1 hypothetical protein RhiirB3_442118 [Rhizophagus irregularis]CAB4494511.1 unnamed protein product [Rhizophagus irregularis]CAB5383533.1 unnamed protein product [Rhizophagus irregularis]
MQEESYYYPYQHNEFLYGLIYSNPKTLQFSNNIKPYFSYINYLKKSESTIIPALKINRNNLNKIKKVKNLKIALPLTDENDRANFMEPDQNLDEYIDIDNDSYQKFQNGFNKPLDSYSNLMNINIKQQESNFGSYKLPNNLRWKPMNKQIEIIRQRKTNYKRPPMYRNKRENYFDDDTLIKQSQDTKLNNYQDVPGLSSFNIWAPWKNKQDAYMAIDEFLRNAKQQVLDHLKSNPKC